MGQGFLVDLYEYPSFFKIRVSLIRNVQYSKDYLISAGGIFFRAKAMVFLTDSHIAKTKIDINEAEELRISEVPTYITYTLCKSFVDITELLANVFGKSNMDSQDIEEQLEKIIAHLQFQLDQFNSQN